MRAKKCICCDDASIKESRSLDDGNERKKVLKKFKCKLCSKSYFLKKSLLEHKNAVHKSIKYDCELCNKSFGYKKLLQKHIKSIHYSVKKNKNFQCKDLKMCQENVREGVKKFSCDLCEKKFSQKVNLKKHVLKIHEGIKQFKCEICKKLFSQKVNFESHQHCQICGKAVSNENVLKRHMLKFHESIKVENCEKNKSEKKFSRHKNKINKKELANFGHRNGPKNSIQPNLNHNMQEIFEKDIGYCCDICGRVFETISTLEKHTFNIHKDNVIPKRIKITGLIRQEKNDGKPISVKDHVYKRVKSHKCNFCSKTFIRSNIFVKHVIDFHQK